MIARHFEQLHGKSEREQRLEEKRIRRLAKLTANEVKKKWRYVEGVSFIGSLFSISAWRGPS
jgi:helicase SWR1